MRNPSYATTLISKVNVRDKFEELLKKEECKYNNMNVLQKNG